MAAFWRNERGADMALPPHLAKYALVLLILNEIRGLIVVAGVVKVWWG